jgi:predicted transcriptional regulator
MYIMKPKKFIFLQEYIGFDRKQIADLLHCSVSTVDAYRAKKESSRNRNMPRLVEKILVDEFVKRGGDLRALKEFDSSLEKSDGC